MRSLNLECFACERLSDILFWSQEYVVVMIANGKTQTQVAEDLEAFLNKGPAQDFAQW